MNLCKCHDMIMNLPKKNPKNLRIVRSVLLKSVCMQHEIKPNKSGT